jgi:predicted DNA-binding mobile mystery protein A
MISTYRLNSFEIISTYRLKLCYGSVMRTSLRDLQILDTRLAAWKSLASTPPPRGWLRAVREALGMPRAELGRRLGVSLQAVAKLEASEADGTIQLDKLRRAAEALDCTLVYALVPNSSLEEVVDRRADAVARRDAGRVLHTMLLEDQRGGEKDEERLIGELAEQAKRSPGLWRE